MIGNSTEPHESAAQCTTPDPKSAVRMPMTKKKKSVMITADKIMKWTLLADTTIVFQLANFMCTSSNTKFSTMSEVAATIETVSWIRLAKM